MMMNQPFNDIRVDVSFTLQECNYLINALIEMHEDREQDPLGFIQLDIIDQLRKRISQKQMDVVAKLS